MQLFYCHNYMKDFGKDYKKAHINISAFIVPSYTVTFPKDKPHKEERIDGLSQKKTMIYKHKKGLFKIQDSQRGKTREDQSIFLNNNYKEFKLKKKKFINQKITFWKSMPKTASFIVVKQKYKSQQQSIKIDTTRTNKISHHVQMPINIQRKAFFYRPKSTARRTLFSDNKSIQLHSPIKIVQVKKQKRERSKTLREDADNNISENDGMSIFSDQINAHNKYQKTQKNIPQLAQHYHGSIDENSKLKRIRLNKSLAKYRTSTCQSIVSQEENIQGQINFLPINIAQIKLNKVTPHRRATIGSYFPQRSKDFQNIQKVSLPLKDEWIQERPSPWQLAQTRNNILLFEEDQF